MELDRWIEALIKLTGGILHFQLVNGVFQRCILKFQLTHVLHMVSRDPILTSLGVSSNMESRGCRDSSLNRGSVVGMVRCGVNVDLDLVQVSRVARGCDNRFLLNGR